jgi:signal transduction histidine kinase
MSNDSGNGDPRWPRLLSLAVHEFRTPVTVVAGYIRMLLKDRAGPLNDMQRRLLEEAEKSCGRLSTLIADMSTLSTLEAGTAPFNHGSLDVAALLADTIASLDPLPDREVNITLQAIADHAPATGDGSRLKTALGAVISALRRELVTSTELCVRLRQDGAAGRRMWRVAIADHEQIETVNGLDEAGLGTFDEWRGGCGLTLAIARRVIDAHGGRIWSPEENGKAGAVLVLPAA